MAPTKNEEPAVLEPGTEVSARFNGAFCEAKIRTIAVLDVKIKVRDLHSGESNTVKHPNIITDLKDLRVQGNARVRSQNGGEPTDVVVLQISDVSTYTVDFNDGDEKNLKRSSLHLKSGKHFDQSISLDNLPLTQPEKFGNVASGSADVPEEGSTNRKRGRNPSVASGATELSDSDVDSIRRSGRTRKTVAPVNRPQKGRPRKDKSARVDESEESSQTDKGSTEDLTAAISEKNSKILRRGPKRIRQEEEEPAATTSSVVTPSVVTPSVATPPVVAPSTKPQPPPVVQEPSPAAVVVPEFPMRSVVCVPQSGRKKCRWLPALVVHPDCRKKPKIDPLTEIRVRLFSNSTYLKVLKDQVKPFSEDLYTAAEEDRVSKLEPDTVLQFLKDRTLPPTWQTTMFTPFEQRDSPEDGLEGDDSTTNRDDSDEESDATRFMIQFIKYRDASGHPDDTKPTIKGQPVDMYKLYRGVQHAGGYNRCNQEDKWQDLLGELDLPEGGATALKSVYQNYLHSGFDIFFRTLATNILDIRHGRNRHQHHVEKEPVATVVLPERRVQSPPPKRPRASSNLVTAKRGRGRPPARPKLSPVAETASSPPISVKEKTPETEEIPLAPPVPVLAPPTPVSAPPTSSKRDLSEESSRKSPTASDDEWLDIRKAVAPNALPIPDTSVLKPGAVVEVLYRNQKGTKPWLPYPARVLDNVGDVAYYVHYANWNKRYDEWKPLPAILKVMDLQEVGAKQYVPTSVFQNRIRSKVKNKEWDRYRVQLDRALAVEEATGTGPSASTGEEMAASKGDLDEDQVSSKSSLETEKKGRKRTMSGKRAGSVGSGPRTEPSPEPLALEMGGATEKPVSPQASTSRGFGEEKDRFSPVGSSVEGEKEKEKEKEPKSTFAKNSKKPSVLIKVETVSRKTEKEKTVLEKKKKTSTAVVVAPAVAVEEERKSPPPKRMMRLAKFLPDVAKTKPVVSPAFITQPPVEVTKKDVVEAVAPPSEKETETAITEKNLSEKKPSPDAEDHLLAAKSSIKRTRRQSASVDSVKSGTSEVKEKFVEEPVVVKKRPYVRKATTKNESKSSAGQSLPESSGKNSGANQTDEIPKISGKISEEKNSVLEIPSVSLSEAEPALPVLQASVAETSLPVPPVPVPVHNVEKDAVLNKATARSTPSKFPTAAFSASKSSSATASSSSASKPSPTVVPSSSSKLSTVVASSSSKLPTVVASSSTVASSSSKSSVQPIVKPPPLKRGRKPKQNRDVDEVVDVILKAPAFALEHKAALERLGLPLDGSESNRETVIDEDEFGNFSRLVVEGVDLTDPDSLPGPPLTGTVRIEAYEKNLNDSLLMLQLMIHRLATGYHILRRCDKIRQDAKDERKERERKNGNKKNDR